MPVFRFRIYWEEDDSVYRDVVITGEQNFRQFHEAILIAFEFDKKHQSAFFRSNDHWQRGRAILLELDEEPREKPPLLMEVTTIASLVTKPNQKFVYVYDFVKNWTFQVELIGLSRELNQKIQYPACIRKEGLGPAQYGTRGLVNEKLVEIEEKYDLASDKLGEEGFGEEGEDGEDGQEEEKESPEEESSPDQEVI
ncbi:MAG TPA: hypothetical protein VMV20_04455 [Chitinophagaceae bacterium]|nr:hypothetical protein [Chitinophagaceae bacterium]